MNNSSARIVERLLRDVLQARKAGDTCKTEVLQSVLTRIANAQAVDARGQSNGAIGVGSTEAERRELTDQQIRQLIQQEADEIRQAISEMAPYQDHPYVAELKAKAAILNDYV